MRKASILAAFSIVICCSSVSAATLDGVRGTVLANSGGGFLRAGNGSSLSPGTRVLAQPSSSAVIIYENGCREAIEPGQIVTVKVNFTCQSAGVTAQPFVFGAAAIGVGVAVAIGSDSKPASP
jgi:hypothetical protein